MKSVLIGFLGFFLPQMVLADFGNFRYELSAFPKGDSDCYGVMIKVVESFKQATGVKVLSFSCVKEADSLCDIEIVYEGEKPVSVVSNARVFGFIDRLGRHSSFQDCEEDLQRESQMFEKETGLKVVFQYCTREEFPDNYPWFPRVEAFGESERVPQISGFHIFSGPKNLTKKGFESAIFKTLFEKGMAPTALVVRSSLAYARVTVHYYAKKRVAFDLNFYTKTNKVEWCQAQLIEAEAIFSRFENSPALLFCGLVAVGRFWELNVLFVGEGKVRVRGSLEFFKSYEECEARKPEVLAYQKDILKQDVKGGLCSWDVKGYRVIFFEPNHLKN